MRSIETSVEWKRRFTSDKYAPGQYKLTLSVRKSYLVIDIEITNAHLPFELTSKSRPINTKLIQESSSNVYIHSSSTGTLNGNLTLSQNGTVRENTYISSAQPLQQIVTISAADMNYLKQNATYIETYWFIDCEYVNKTDGLTGM